MGNIPVKENFCYKGGLHSYVEYIHKKQGLDPLHEDILHFYAEAPTEIPLWNWLCSTTTAIRN